MPTLPTLDVTADQAARLLAAYAPHPGATQAETIANYKERLRQWNVENVIAFEVAQVQQQVTQAAVTRKAEVISAMPPPPQPVAQPAPEMPPA